jgi:Domain of unknown function (DUF5667)
MMKRPNASVEEILDRCLTRIAKGGATVEACLAEYPELADELQPLLEMALQARAERPSLAPRAAFAQTSEQRLKNLLRARQPAPTRRPEAPRRAWQPQIWRRLVPVGLTAVLVAAIGLGGLSVVSASAGALPGDGLYLVKRGLEEVRLVLTLDPESEADLLSSYADERLEEIQTLSEAGRLEDLESAVAHYAVAIGRLAKASLEAGQSWPQDVMDKLTWHIAVLEEVQSNVPGPAQQAIENAIEHSIDAETGVLPDDVSTPDPDCIPSGPPGCPGDPGQDQDLRMAEQIAKIYGVTPEQALAVYQGVCQLDWKCVRTYLRGSPPGQELHENQKDKKPHP